VYTEKQAKTKICPIIPSKFIIHTEAGSREGVIYCYASDCMMWRYGGEVEVPVYHGEAGKRFVPGGYCGLAGIPKQ